MKTSNTPVIVSHRGGKGPYLENTLNAFRHSIREGADAVEMDVRYDYLRRRFYLAHDFIHRPKWRQNLLEKTVATMPKDVLHIIELKTVSVFTNIFAKQFCRFYDEHLQGRKVVVISFNPFILIRMKLLAPHISRGFISGSRFWNTVFVKLLHIYIVPSLHVIHRRLLSEKLVDFSRSKGMEIYTYLINTVNTWQKAIQHEVDGIITDDPFKFMQQIPKS